MITNKIYLSNMYQKEGTARVIAIEGNKITLDRTIFFAEGGGQVGDTGFIDEIKICNTLKKFVRETRTLIHADFPAIQVDTAVQHIAEGNMGILKTGDKVTMKIDWDRRYKTMRMHSAAHIVLNFCYKLFEEKIPLKGCYIHPDKSRLDFSTKFDPNKMEELQFMSNTYIGERHVIYNVPLKNEPEALYWICGDIKIPCGGTHVTNTSEIGKVKLKRRSQGKHTDRLYIQIQ